MIRVRILLLAGMILSVLRPAAGAEPIEVKAVILKLIAQAEVPAQAAGVLRSVEVKEGDAVEPGALLAQVEATEVALQRDQAELELRIAEREAANETDVQAATQELAVAEEDLRRANRSRERFADSISPSELDHLRLSVAIAELKLQRAKHLLDVARMSSLLKQKSVAQAEQALERHRVTSPLKGVVVELYRTPGEWVEPGDKVARVIRVDRLRAEGFLDVTDTRSELVGKPIVLRVDLPGRPNASFAGTLVFVSPEVDPVNHQTRVWAEIENPSRQLYPGLRARMTIP